MWRVTILRSNGKPSLLARRRTVQAAMWFTEDVARVEIPHRGDYLIGK